MFAARRACLAPLHTPCSRRIISRRPHRTFVTSAVEALSDGFLDLATALPLPPSLPPYSTTIILFTVVSRLVVTLPFSVWAQQRRWRLQEVVHPTLQEMVPKVNAEVIENIQKEGHLTLPKDVFNNKEKRAQLNVKLNKMVKERTTKIINERQKQMLVQYNCGPRLTFLLPIMTQLPLFFGSSVVLSHLCQSPTPFDAESFLTLSNLSHVDPTTTLPIVLGFITLANVESSTWFMTTAQRERKAAADVQFQKQAEAGVIKFEWSRIVKPALRFASVGRVILASMVPGGVVLYWVSSAAFGLLQTWAFDYWTLRRRRAIELNTPPAPSSTTSAAPAHAPKMLASSRTPARKR